MSEFGGGPFGGDPFGGPDGGESIAPPTPPPSVPGLLFPASPGPGLPIQPTARCLRMLDTMPPYYWTDPTIVRLIQVVANELDRCEAFLDSVKNGLVPLLADDSLGMLAIWEKILRLPVEPAGVSLATRQQAVQAALLARNCRTTQQWVTALSAAAGTTGWTRQFCVPAPGYVTFSFPIIAGSYIDGVLRTLARRLTPANYYVLFVGDAIPVGPPPPPPPPPPPIIGPPGTWIAGVSVAGVDEG